MAALNAILGETEAPRTVAQTVGDRLRKLIIAGTLPPGTQLRLNPLAERLGVSVMPVREAIRQLEADRLVVVTPRRGAVVADLSVEDAEETYAVRVALESLCAARAAERLTDEDVVELNELFFRMEEAERQGDLHVFMQADHDFHDRLYQASGRERLVKTIRELMELSSRYQPYVFGAWHTLEEPLEGHRPLLDAIRARDASLVQALTREHMESSAARVLKAIRVAHAPSDSVGSEARGRSHARDNR